MKILEEDIKEYQELCSRHLGHSITPELAREELGELVTQMMVVYQPMTAEELKQLTGSQFRLLRDIAKKGGLYDDRQPVLA